MNEPIKISVKFGKTVKTFQVIPSPVPHILVDDSKKELHGWYVSNKTGKISADCADKMTWGKRECTAERALINPYNGCSHRCPFCYALNFWGYFELFRNRGLITVFENFPRSISRQLDSVNVMSCGYLSPVTDPFQPLNLKYRLSEKIIKEFVERNIPIEFVTKGNISREAIDLIKKHKQSFGQVSILTLNEDLRQKLVPGGAKTNVLLKNFKRLKEAGIFAVARVDPIIPLVTDDLKEIKSLIKEVAYFGADHVIASCLDLPWRIRSQTTQTLTRINPEVRRSYISLYADRIDGYYQADLEYRKKLFWEMRDICDSEGVTFALCMEYEDKNGRTHGLNREFSNVKNCEGIDIPIYIRNGKKFEPVADCSGACLNCSAPLCGLTDLAMKKDNAKKDWKLADYRRWSKLRGLKDFAFL